MDDNPGTDHTVSCATLHSGHGSPDGPDGHAEELGAFSMAVAPVSSASSRVRAFLVSDAGRPPRLPQARSCALL